MLRKHHGFSVLELVIAMGVLVGITATMFSLMNPAQDTFSAQPEVSDMQQRLRVAQDTLYKELVMAGAGAYLGKQSTGSLVSFFAPVLPYRQGAVGDDGIGKFKTDTLTVLHVPSTTAQTTISQTVTATGAKTIKITLGSDCTAGQVACGFTQGMTGLLFDDTGSFDTFVVTGVPAGDSVPASFNRPPSAPGTVYQPGAKVVEAVDRTYYLKVDAAAKTSQLMYYDGSANADVPVVDNVVNLAFDYYGDPQPPTMRGVWTSYGPKPALVPLPPYPAGENCVFISDGSPTPAPRLPVLGTGQNGNTLVRLTSAQLTDGPWCSDAANANRWDADLLRIRKIGVTLRVQAAIDSLRGPAGTLFRNGGTSRGGNKFVPDQEIRFQVSPRNLNLGR
jgi:Tfp pilus assembly protein PilW